MYVAQLIKKIQMCLPLFGTAASWLHSQGTLKISSQAADVSVHHQQAAPALGERIESFCGNFRIKAERDLTGH
jgi:hypothetical protein